LFDYLSVHLMYFLIYLEGCNCSLFSLKCLQLSSLHPGGSRDNAVNANLRCFKDHPCVMGPCIPSVMFDKLLVLIFVIAQRNMHAFVLNQCLSSSCFFFSFFIT
jgi:hypothetical protein